MFDIWGTHLNEYGYYSRSEWDGGPSRLDIFIFELSEIVSPSLWENYYT